MFYLKITTGILGIILLVPVLIISLRIRANLKNNGVRNIKSYVKTNPDLAKKTKVLGYIGSIGFWLLVIALYINS